MTHVDFINASTVVTDTDAAIVVAALQYQVTHHYAPAWGTIADVNFVAKGKTPRKKAWQIVILDDSDQAGALGYHDMTREGLPIGKVFAKTDIKYGLKWSVTASHELLEMLGDPGINLTVFVESEARLYSFENCDACEKDSFGYDVHGVLVSDFVFPEWFEPFWSPGATQFDFGKHIDRPLKLLDGGYIGIYDLARGGGWQQLTAQTTDARYAAKARPAVGSRRERRRTPLKDWQKSTR